MVLTSQSLRQYGLVGSFNTICNMSGERVALITSFDIEKDLEDNDDDDDFDDDRIRDTKDNDEDSNYDAIDTTMDHTDYNQDQESIESYDDEACTYSDSNQEQDGIMYMELQYNAKQLAKQLYHRFGVKEEDRVLIICKDCRAAEIVSILACLYIKAIFVPIDDKWLCNSLRMNDIISNCQPAAAIVVGDNDSDPSVLFLASLQHYKCVLISRVDGSLVEGDTTMSSNIEDFLYSNSQTNKDSESAEQISCVDLYRPIYILYTSGSTGIPKGVIGTELGLVNRITWQMNHFPWSSREVMCRRTPLTFVDSMAEIFGALLNMVPLYLLDARDILGTIVAASLMAKMRISRITLIPRQLLMLLQNNSEAVLKEWKSLKYVHISGEECPYSLPRIFQQIWPDKYLLNLYGSTEVAGDITCAILCSPQLSNTHESIHSDALSKDTYLFNTTVDPVPSTSYISTNKIDSEAKKLYPYATSIGKVMDNNYVFVVKPLIINEQVYFEIVSESFIGGDLLVIGENVSLGYFNHDKLNSNSIVNTARTVGFIDNPFLHNMIRYNNSITQHVTNINSMTLERICSYKTAFLMGDVIIQEYCTSSEKANHNSGNDLNLGILESVERNENITYKWIGRKDTQVKIRGVRLELAEVERNIMHVLGIQEGVVISTYSLPVKNTNSNHKIEEVVAAKEEDEGNQKDLYYEEILVMFIIESAMAAIQCISEIHRDRLNNLRNYLGAKLPPAFIPTLILPVTKLPYTSSFKVDRKEMEKLLHEIVPSSEADTKYQIGQSIVVSNSSSIISMEERKHIDDMELLIIKVFEMVLSKKLMQLLLSSSSNGNTDNYRYNSNTSSQNETLGVIDGTSVQSIYAHRSFYEIGGDSLKAIEVIWKLKQEINHSSSSEAINGGFTIHDLQLTIHELATKLIILTSTKDNNSKRSGVIDELRNENRTEIQKKHTINTIETNIPIGKKLKIANKSNIKPTTYIGDVGDALNRNNLSNHQNIAWISRNTIHYNTSEVAPESNSSYVNAESIIVSNSVVKTHCLRMEFVWKYQMERCMDFTPLLIFTIDPSVINTDNTDGFGSEILHRKNNMIVYTGSHSGDFAAINASNGEMIWKLQFSEHIDSFAVCNSDATLIYLTTYSGKDIDGPVVIENDHNNDDNEIDQDHQVISISTKLHSHGTLWAIDSYSGEISWYQDIYGELKGGPLYCGCKGYSDDNNKEIVVVGSHDGCVYIYDAQQGILIDRLDLGLGSIYATPIKMNGFDGNILIIIGTTQGYILVISYSYHENNNSCHIVCQYNGTRDIPIFSTPIIDPMNPQHVIFALVDGSIRCFEFVVTPRSDIESIDPVLTETITTVSYECIEIWNKKLGMKPFFSSPCIHPQQLSFIIGCHDGHIRHISFATGDVLWDVNLSNIIIFSSPFMYRNLCVVSNTAGEITALGLEKGSIECTYNLPAEIYSSPVVHNDHLYIGCRDNFLYCINISF